LAGNELFGYRKRRFSGVIGSQGLFGTPPTRAPCFLDEIGDMPCAAAQAKLLRVLQEGELPAVGSKRNAQG